MARLSHPAGFCGATCARRSSISKCDNPGARVRRVAMNRLSKSTARMPWLRVSRVEDSQRKAMRAPHVLRREEDEMRRRWIVWVLTVGLLAGLAVPAAGKARDAVTYGDVVAHFQAAETAGPVIFFRTPAGFTAAAANPFENGIRPLPWWDGLHYCEDDWHLLVLGLFFAVPDDVASYKEANALLNVISVDFVLDGESRQATHRTVTKNFPGGLGFDEDGNVIEVNRGFTQQHGEFYPPGTLSVGAHTLGATITFDGEEFSNPDITFHIDGSGTGSCLGE